MNPLNCALTIIDFELREEKRNKDEENAIKIMAPRLVAHNMQIISNHSDISPMDFTP